MFLVTRETQRARGPTLDQLQLQVYYSGHMTDVGDTTFGSINSTDIGVPADESIWKHASRHNRVALRRQRGGSLRVSLRQC